MRQYQKRDASNRAGDRLSVVIFGIGDFSRVVSSYIQDCTSWRIAAYTVEEAYITDSVFDGVPIVPFESIEKQYPPAEYEMIIACGYRGMGALKKRVSEIAIEKGYDLPNLIHPSACLGRVRFGYGNIVQERAIIGPGVEIGSCNVIGPGCNVGHDSTIGDYCTLTGNVMTGGFVRIGDNSFLGISSTVQNQVRIAPYTMVGATCYVSKSTKEGEAYAASSSAKLQKLSSKRVMDFWQRTCVGG